MRETWKKERERVIKMNKHNVYILNMLDRERGEDYRNCMKEVLRIRFLRKHRGCRWQRRGRDGVMRAVIIEAGGVKVNEGRQKGRLMIRGPSYMN